MQHINLKNEDMQKALQHLNKLIELEGLEQSYQTYKNDNSYNQNNSSLMINKNINDNLNGQYIMNHDQKRYSQTYSSNDSIQQQQSLQFNQSQSNQKKKYPPNDIITSEQEFHDDNEYDQYNNNHFQTISSIQKDPQSIHQQQHGQYYNDQISYQQSVNRDSIQQSQTDTEYLEEIKKLVNGRKSQLDSSLQQEDQQNQIHGDNNNNNRIDYIEKNNKLNQDYNQYYENNQQNNNNNNNTSSSSSSSDNDIEEQQDNYNEYNSKQKHNQQNQRNHTPSQQQQKIQDISERLFQDGKVRQQKNSIKKLEAQLEQCYRSKDDRQIILNNETKKIIDKKIQQGEYKPIQERWNTFLQVKAEKMLEAKTKQEFIQQQIDKKDLTFKPEINSHSQSIISNRTHEQVVNALHSWNKRKLDKLFNSQFRENEKACQNLTFHPKINHVSAKLMEKNGQEDEDVVKRLYKRMEEVVNKKELLKQEQFHSKHTFKPKVNEKSMQIVQEQNYRSQVHNVQQHQERSLTPGLNRNKKMNVNDEIKGNNNKHTMSKNDTNKKNNNNELNKDRYRSKTPTHHSYSRSITPNNSKKSNNFNHSQTYIKQNLIQYSSNSKENLFNPISSNSNGQNNNNHSNHMQSHSQFIDSQSYSSTKDNNKLNDYYYNQKEDRILQQNNEKLNTLTFSPMKQSFIKNYYSPSINSSFNMVDLKQQQQHQQSKQNQSMQIQSVQIQNQNIKNRNKNSNQTQQLLKDHQHNSQESQLHLYQNQLTNYQHSSSKSPYSRSNNNNIHNNNNNKNNNIHINQSSNINSLSPTPKSTCQTAVQQRKTEYYQKPSEKNNNFVCCPDNPHVNTQEIELNNKLQFLLDLLSSEEKKKYSNHIIMQDLDYSTSLQN